MQKYGVGMAFFFIGVLGVSAARAAAAVPGKWDYAYALGLRSEPLGLSVWGELGYNHLLWGDGASTDNPFYGYIRPKISARSSGVVNRADVGVDFAFWAPAVLELTYSWDHRRKDFSAFNCTMLQCRGMLTRAKAAMKVTLGYGSYFLLSDFILERVSGPKSPEQDFADHSWTLAGRYPRDTMFSTEVTAGVKLSEKWSVGLTGARSEFLSSNEISHTGMAFASLRESGLRYFVGAGVYESTRFAPGFTSAFGLKWVGSDSFSLR